MITRFNPVSPRMAQCGKYIPHFEGIYEIFLDFFKLDGGILLRLMKLTKFCNLANVLYQSY